MATTMDRKIILLSLQILPVMNPECLARIRLFQEACKWKLARNSNPGPKLPRVRHSFLIKDLIPSLPKLVIVKKLRRKRIRRLKSWLLQPQVVQILFQPLLAHHHPPVMHQIKSPPCLRWRRQQLLLQRRRQLKVCNLWRPKSGHNH